MFLMLHWLLSFMLMKKKFYRQILKPCNKTAKAWKLCLIDYCCCQCFLCMESNSSLFPDLSRPPFRFTGFSQSQAMPAFSIYRIFTGSSQAHFFDLQGFYRVKPGLLFWFTGFLQVQARPAFSIYRVFTESS